MTTIVVTSYDHYQVSEALILLGFFFLSSVFCFFALKTGSCQAEHRRKNRGATRWLEMIPFFVISEKEGLFIFLIIKKAPPICVFDWCIHKSSSRIYRESFAVTFIRSCLCAGSRLPKEPKGLGLDAFLTMETGGLAGVVFTMPPALSGSVLWGSRGRKPLCKPTGGRVFCIAKHILAKDKSTHYNGFAKNPFALVCVLMNLTLNYFVLYSK